MLPDTDDEGAQLVIRRVVERLTAAGHAVDDCDLYAENFDPRLTRTERLGYHDQRGPGDGPHAYDARMAARWYFGWSIVAAAAMLTLLSTGMRLSFGPFFLPIASDLGFSRSLLATIVANAGTDFRRVECGTDGIVTVRTGSVTA